MSSANFVFQPGLADTVAVSASGTTSNGALNKPTAPAGALTVRIHNGGSVTAFIQFGNSAAVEATTSHMPIPPNGVEVFSVGDATHVAAVTASGTTTVYLTTGYGA